MAQKSLFSEPDMPALAYLFASQNQLPSNGDNAWFESACTWIHSLSSAWERLAKNLPAGEKPPEPAYKNLSTNMANMPPSKCREIASQADDAAKKLLQIWKDTGVMPAIDAGLIAELTGLKSKISIDYLTGYRGGFKSIPKQKLKHGVSDAFLMISSAPFEFKITQNYSTELHIFSEISRAHGADALALWTWGSSIGLLLAKNSIPGSRPQFIGPLHITARTRSEEHIARLLRFLREAFNGSRFQPDWSSTEAQLKTPDLSVSKWFAAFGLPGAPENSPANANVLWESWDHASHAILTGKKPDAKDAKVIKAALEQTGSDEKFSIKPAKGDGSIAYPLAGIGLTLARANSLPEDSIWQRRARAAELYGAIANNGVAEWLTVGVDSKNLGASASLGRLLQVYAAEFRNDRLWAMQSVLVAEAWNGHAFVQPLAALAEGIDTRLALVLYPASAREAFRKEFGIEGGNGSANAKWEAEAFIETVAWPKQKPSKLLPRWIEKQGLNAVLILSGPQSIVNVWSQGKETTADPGTIGLGRFPSSDELARAGRDLDVRPLLDALEQSRLLKPPPLDTEIQFAPAKRVMAMKALTATVPEINLSESPGNFSSAATAAVEGADYKNSRLICLLATGLEAPKTFAGDLAALLGKGSDVWQNGENVCACGDSIPDWKLLAGLLGDAPAGASLTVVNTDGVGFKIVQS
jgi:hypothetical protein